MQDWAGQILPSTLIDGVSKKWMEGRDISWSVAFFSVIMGLTWNDVLRGKEQWQVFQAQRKLGDDHADSSSSARPSIILCEEMGKPKTTNKQTETNQMPLSFNKVVKIFFTKKTNYCWFL